MSGGDKQPENFYKVLGLKPDCSSSELRNAYKKLAMRWHPDRWSGLGNAKAAEESKKKFQAIQEAYSVLSDDSKRFLYDAGVYEDDDDDGMRDFLGEMMGMMNESKAQTSGFESFEELQDLFMEMFEADINNFNKRKNHPAGEGSSGYKRDCSEIQAGSVRRQEIREPSFMMGSVASFSFESFCVGSQECQPNGRAKRGNTTKQR
uniref:TSA: Wollemia nobilis Ref_Wollemi_Transcript_7129_1095 transcribed RNA sequence n=1 Tax=Wollemia nobilis TaxID=56998 RepID=A0A0C9S7Z7_9CONI